MPLASHPGTFKPSYPSNGTAYERFQIVYTAGYGPYPHHIDDGLSQATCMVVAGLHESRGDILVGSARPDTFAEQLLGPYRVWTPPT